MSNWWWEHLSLEERLLAEQAERSKTPPNRNSRWQSTLRSRIETRFRRRAALIDQRRRSSALSAPSLVAAVGPVDG